LGCCAATGLGWLGAGLLGGGGLAIGELVQKP